MVCIHTSFPAGRTVHHGQQSGRNLDMRNASVINRRYESRNIANHPATETNDERCTVKPSRDHPIANRADLLKRLRFLARWNYDRSRTESSCEQTFLDATRKQSRDITIGDNDARIAWQILARVLSYPVENAGVDQHRVAVGTNANLQNAFD